MMTVRDRTTGLIITQMSTTDITNTSWSAYGLKWVMPSGFSSIVFELTNDAQGGCGNDIALDDIQFGTCDALPSITISATSAGCLGGSTTFTSSLSDGGVIPGAKDYQWQISTDNISWSDIAGAISSSYTINPVTASAINKYYRALVAAAGNISNASCRYTSNSYLLTAKNPSTDPTSAGRNRNNICPGDAVSLQVNGGSLGTNAVWRWYSGSCGGTLVGTGSTITVNPTVTTTYYVRAEGDCNNTNCASVTITVNCDIDDDNDGITDVAESGRADPQDDSDFDGIPDYRDINYPGFVDVNGDGINDNFDNDKDGIINELDLDSDNDGIPDVVESGGVDANGDGRIDNYTDTDNDGLSQNVDANNTGHTGSGTGLGIPDSDGDGVANIFDFDSDNDGIPDVREVTGTDVNNDGKTDSFTDSDSDGYSDNVDSDVGNDGVAETPSKALLRTGPDGDNNGRADNYPFKNFDSDTRANAYDLDSDNDGITDVREAGFTDANSNGFSDGIKGADGWDDSIDAMPTLTLRNSDTDPNFDYLDVDSDHDGIPDNIEGISTSGYKFPLYADSDGDGIDNNYDNVMGFGGNGNTPNNQDGDALPDYIDQDTDSDGQMDSIEGNDFNQNTLPDDNVTLTGIDTDGDGLDNRFDADNSSIKGTSRYMGISGSLSGDPSPGSNAVVQRSYAATERDWRSVAFVLDVNFLNITGNRNSEAMVLHWTVTCEKVIDHFDIERSVNGTDFVKIGEKKGIGTSCHSTAFEYADNTTGIVANSVYYRVNAITADNANKRSRFIIIHNQPSTTVVVAPNPATNYVTVNVMAVQDGLSDIKISDASGRVVLKRQFRTNSGNNSFTIEDMEYLTRGVYTIQVKLGYEIFHKKLVIQR